MTGAQGTSPRRFWLYIGLAWLAVSASLIIRQWSAIHSFRLPEPDDALRLVQVRDLLAGQSWFDLQQYRIDPPAGVATHWSRLVDLPLAGVVLMLTPLTGQTGAELAAAVIVPLLTLLCAMLLTARIARRLFGVPAAYAACLVWIMALIPLVQLQPMRIDHHGWQIVAVLAAINGMLAHDARRGGWIVGGSLALGMSISLELLPFTALFAAVLGLRWLRGPSQRSWLVHMLFALAAVSTASYVLTRGLVADNYCDTVSPAHLTGLAVAAALVAGIAALRSLGSIWLATLLGGAALVVGGIYLALSPQCLAGPFAALDPLVRLVWYNNILEGMPVWRQTGASILQMTIPVLAGLAITAAAYWHAAGERRALLGDLALLLLGAIAIAMLVARFSGVAAAIAIAPLGYAITEWLRRAPAMPAAARTAALPLILLVLFPGVAAEPLLARLRTPGMASGARIEPPPAIGGGCSLPASLPALTALAPATILAPFEVSPIILRATRHRVVATGHHRAASAMKDVIAAYLAPPARAEAIVRRHGAHYVAACGDMVEARNYRAYAPNGLMAQLLAGQVPDWLDPVVLPTLAGELKLYRVKPQPGLNVSASPSRQ